MPLKTNTLYEKIADDIALQIKAEVYKGGEKLPSIRQLSRQRSVSVATVQKAYELLEDRRLVEPRPKSGFYVRAIDRKSPSQKVDLLGLPNQVQIHNMATDILYACEGEGITNLGTAYPSIEFLPIKQLQRIMRKLIQLEMKDLVVAHFSSGLRQLKHQICRRLAEAQCQVDEEEVIVTNGCQEALTLCLRAVSKPGDTIAIESPAFVGLLQAIESLGLKALEIPSDCVEGISLEALELALDQWQIAAVALVPAFNNPSGSDMPLDNKKHLVELLSQKGVPLIEDDLFGDLAHDGFRIPPAKAFDKNGLVLYCSSISKSVAPGFRVGWVCPGIYTAKIEGLKSFTNVSASSIAQASVAQFLSTGAYDRHIRHLRKEYANHLEWFQKNIELHFPLGTTISAPKGGYILWIELPMQCDTGKMFYDAIEKNVSFLPGKLFSTSSKFSHCLRINCSVSINDDISNAIVTLGQIAHRHT